MHLSTSSVKRLLIGRPFPTRADVDERLDKVRGLAIFASDPIISNAYATEAIMTVLWPVFAQRPGPWLAGSEDRRVGLTVPRPGITAAQRRARR